MSQELDGQLIRGRAVAENLVKTYDRSQMDALLKQSNTDPSKIDLCQRLKQGQTVIRCLDSESSRNDLKSLIKESKQLFGRPTLSGPRVQQMTVK